MAISRIGFNKALSAERAEIVSDEPVDTFITGPLFIAVYEDEYDGWLYSVDHEDVGLVTYYRADTFAEIEAAFDVESDEE